MGLIPQLNESFDQAVELMFNCKGKIIVTGVGKSGHIGAKIAATLPVPAHPRSSLIRWTYFMAISVSWHKETW